MPIKDISKEEQAHLFLTGGVKREHMQLTESDRGDIKYSDHIFIFLTTKQLQPTFIQSCL